MSGTDSGQSTLVTAYPQLNQAAQLLAAGKFDQAAQHAMAHLRRHPDEPRGLAQLGEIAMHLGALGQAEHFLRRALSLGARDPKVRRSLASTLNQQERLPEALDIFEDLARETGDPALSGIRAIILDKLGRHEEAMAIRAELTRSADGKPHSWIGYGHSLRSAGRVEEAIDAYRKAVAADFEYGEGWWGLASIKQRVFTDDDVEEMRRAIGIAIDVRNSAPLHFALARALHDRGQYAEAFTHYAEGNRQRAESLGYDARELSDEVAEVEHGVDATFIQRLEQGAGTSGGPIFIVSLPRSGSTLLEQMLGSHSKIEAIGELPYAPAILRSAMELATRRGRITVPQLIQNLGAQQAQAMGEDNLRRAALHRKTGRPYFIDKLPHNWSNILFIRKILPEARFIDIRRDPIDCCFSNFTQSFSSAHASSFSLHDIGRCYVDYVRLMKHLDRVAPGMVHHVRYEDLIEDAETHLRAVLDYLDLPWDAEVLEFHKLDRVVRTPSSEQVRRPLNREGVEAWKPYERWLGPLRSTLSELS